MEHGFGNRKEILLYDTKIEISIHYYIIVGTLKITTPFYQSHIIDMLGTFYIIS